MGGLSWCSAHSQCYEIRRLTHLPLIVSTLVHVMSCCLIASEPVFTYQSWGPAAVHFDGLVQDCSNSSALAMELLQSCTKPSIYLRAMLQGMFVYDVIHEFVCLKDKENNGLLLFVNSWTAGNSWIHNQHCGYWCPGAKTPGHQYQQCWLCTYCMGPDSYKLWHLLQTTH